MITMTMTDTTLRITPLDAWLSADEVFNADWPHSRELRLSRIREALAVHCAQNSYFREYLAAHHFTPATLTEDTLGSVPLLPAGLFKRSADRIRTGTAAAIDTTSSGTQGSISHVPRDDTTMQRFFASVAAATKELLDIEHAETLVRNIGARVDETQHLWIAYVMAGVSVLHETEFFIRNGTLDFERLVSALAEDPTDAPSLIVGPPPIVLDIAHRLQTSPLPAHDRRFVITIGGWKRSEGERVRREVFDHEVVAAFGLQGADRVRDAFNMVELNTVIIECAEHRKHCPPWLYASARDPHTLRELHDEPGLLGYVDPTPTSFPGAVLSEDFGWVDRDQTCPCGITGDVLRIERRVNRLESRGCAMKI
jgi:long-chain-fatty-acid---luciferin-component ligase